MKNRKPLIGVTPLYDPETDKWWIQLPYMKHLEVNGAVPVMIQPTTDTNTLEETLKYLDGVLLTGGPDVDPAHYGEKILPECGYICKERDVIDCFIARRAMELDLPIFGICRGHQVINAALGGALYQDIPSQIGKSINHRPGLPEPHDIAHTVTFTEGNPIARCLGRKTVEVNSFHHQSVKTPAPGIEIAATSPDGVVEALYHKEHRFVWGLQWHPEKMPVTDPVSIKLFSAFIEACK
ncbi:MAG: gamma-glutamyl-gamma-aminobutyrate hydrolase family protein [Lentisphaeria bacterium]|nr:gamma-glutamyl-gamma-aminobutyrate hydrolase family protein [Lentisphaeria bacterium]